MRATAARADIGDLILDAADRLLGRYGFAKMTMDDLAREVGIAKATLYQHFGGKEEVALARIDRVMDRLLHQMAAVASERSDAVKRLRSMLVLRVKFRLDHVRGGFESIEQQLADIRPTLRIKQREYFNKEADLIAAVLREGQRSGVFRLRNVKETSVSLVLATNGLIPSNLLLLDDQHRNDLDKHINQIADLLSVGLSLK